ncbi:calcium/sodium antiporter [Candidatus Woesearchaeota archaeon]|nr:calcium/sodium antiporter [Candidatus Woesearchaeota archaeon]
MLFNLLLLLMGMFFVWLSAELIIYTSKKIANHFNLSDTFFGLTVLSIGTSLPEIGTHIAGSLQVLAGNDASGLVIGTNIGSNTVQITAILGIVGFFMLIKAKREFLKRDYIFMLASIVLVFLFSLNHYLSRIEGFMLIALYLIYLYYLGKKEFFTSGINHNHKKNGDGVVKNVFFLIIGLIILLYTSSFVVENGEKLAEGWDVSDSLIGVSLIGIGTALPELATALVALRRRSSGMSLGVLVGSNITNPLLALGIGVLISGYTVSNTILWIDLPVWFFASLAVLLLVAANNQLTKRDSVVLLFLYFLYMGFRVFVIQ